MAFTSCFKTSLLAVLVVILGAGATGAPSRQSTSMHLPVQRSASGDAVPSTSTNNSRAASNDQSSMQPLSEFVSVLSLEQLTYFPAGWLGTNAWEGAVGGTLLASSLRTLTAALQLNTDDGGANAAAGQLMVENFYVQLQQYYLVEPITTISTQAFDDYQWVVLEWLEAIRAVRQFDASSGLTIGQTDLAGFAHRAHVFYDLVQDKFDRSLCGGGITWNPRLDTYKNAVTNELLVASSVGMYLYHPGDNNTAGLADELGLGLDGTLPADVNAPVTIPVLEAHDPSLLQTAQESYAWFRGQGFTNAQGLVIDGFHVAAGQTACNQPSEDVYTYNQGIILSGMRQLWEATGDAAYLDDGYDMIATAMRATGWEGASSRSSSSSSSRSSTSTSTPNLRPKNSTSISAEAASPFAGLGRGGVMEDLCDTDSDPDGGCNMDQRIFKGVYFHHLGLFCEALPTDAPTVPGISFLATADLARAHSDHCAEYQAWTAHNAQAAMKSRDASSGIIGGLWGAAPGQALGIKVEHTVETQLAGLAVVKAAWDLSQV